jgi:hypothetical protein
MTDRPDTESQDSRGRNFMVSLFLRFLCVIAAACLFAGCATLPKPSKEAVEKPGIVEEDIRDNESTSGEPERERAPARTPVEPEYGSSPAQPPSGPAEQFAPPPAPDYSDQKQPRRFIWRDRNNGRKSWKPAPSDSE